MKHGGFGKDDAERIARSVRYTESMSGDLRGPKQRRIPKRQDYVAIVHAVLTEDLLSGDSATATLLYQDTDGVWSAGDPTDDEVIIYASEYAGSFPISAGKKLADGVVVIAARNPASGCLNLIGSWTCETTA